MIRALVVDDHPAVLSGLVTALRSEPGFVPLGTAAGVREALSEAERHVPNVALVDYQLADGNGLLLCHELKQLRSPPAVLIYSGFARSELTLAAAVAGADGMVDKGVPLDELLDAIRTVVKGGTLLPAPRPAALERMLTRLEPEDVPILGMRIDGATLSEIATVLHRDESEVSRRLVAILGRLAGGLRADVVGERVEPWQDAPR